MTLRCNTQITIISAYAPTESARLESKDSFYDKLHIAISSIPAHNFFIDLGDLMYVLEKFLMILSHKLLADTHITKTPTITANNLLPCVRTGNLYPLSIANYIKITTCGLGNTVMAFIEHILAIFY